MQFQSILIETGVRLLEKELVRDTKSFRYAVFSGAGSNDKLNQQQGQKYHATSIDKEFSVFGRSAAYLTRLATFLLEAFKTCNKANLPLVLAAANGERDTYLVVGRVALSRGGETKRK